MFYLIQAERGESAQSHSPPHPEPATISPTPSEEKAVLSSLTSIHDVIQVINLQKVRIYHSKSKEEGKDQEWIHREY